jgi:hypothetical protein
MCSFSTTIRLHAAGTAQLGLTASFERPAEPLFSRVFRKMVVEGSNNLLCD